MILSPRLQLFCLSASVMVSGITAADETATSELPKVVIVGDSIRLSYAPTVVKQLAERAAIVSPEANGGDSNNVLKHLDQWVISQKPTIVHFNCGIHDTMLSGSNQAFKLEDLIGTDGVHLQPKAKEVLGKAVAEFISTHLPSSQD